MDSALFQKVLTGEVDLNTLSKEEKLQFLDLLEEKEKRLDTEIGQKSLIEFAKQVYPNYSVGAHHRKMAQIFEDVAAGKKKRVIINIAPRHGKSELTSYLFPAWFLGQRPDAKIIMATHTASYPNNLAEECETSSTARTTPAFSPVQRCRQILRALDHGLRLSRASITLLVLGALWLVAVLTFWLLTILTPNRTLSQVPTRFLNRHGLGIRPVQDSD